MDDGPFRSQGAKNRQENVGVHFGLTELEVLLTKRQGHSWLDMYIPASLALRWPWNPGGDGGAGGGSGG